MRERETGESERARERESAAGEGQTRHALASTVWPYRFEYTLLNARKYLFFLLSPFAVARHTCNVTALLHPLVVVRLFHLSMCTPHNLRDLSRCPQNPYTSFIFVTCRPQPARSLHVISRPFNRSPPYVDPRVIFLKVPT